jgi:hypothetical protein
VADWSYCRRNPLALKERGYTKEGRDKTYNEVGGEIDCIERIAGILVQINCWKSYLKRSSMVRR